MYKHLEREIEHLKKQFSALSTVVEENFIQAIKAFKTLDASQSKIVIDNDEKIDQMEIAVEEECLKLLALYQPVAVDLRYIITILKINNDLERIGDLSCNIAKCTVSLSEIPNFDIPSLFPVMTHKTHVMLEKSLEALSSFDCNLAYEVCRLDSDVDELKASLEKELILAIQAEPMHVERMLRLLSISRYLERIADHATNIAEDVIYSVQGEIIRHQ